MWASIVEQVAGVELSGVVEVNPATLAVFGAEHPDMLSFTDLTEALAGTSSDAVLLVTPPDGHLARARLSVER